MLQSGIALKPRHQEERRYIYTMDKNGFFGNKNSLHNDLISLLQKHEEWLMRKVLDYARRQNYTKYTSTLIEAWRISIQGLTSSLTESLGQYRDIPELGPDDDYTKDPLAVFGIVEAQKHRERGITLAMFLGLLKYYRQSYIDLMEYLSLNPEETSYCILYINRSFDRIELGFCTEWLSQENEDLMKELQDANRKITNEKNRYLTVFESSPLAVMLFDAENRLINLNNTGSRIFLGREIPGDYYYGDRGKTIPHFEEIAHELNYIRSRPSGEHFFFEKVISTADGLRFFEITMKRMMDISEKYEGTVVIFNDITERKEAQKKVNMLSGLIPICSHCKKIRDDQGYWNQLEIFIRDHSNADFTHGICPECAEKYFFRKTGKKSEGGSPDHD